MDDGSAAAPLTERRPVPGCRWGAAELTLDGRDRLQAVVDGRIGSAPVMHLTGFCFASVDPDGTTTVAMPASPWWQSGVGVFLPGTLAFVLDSALGAPVVASLPPWTAMATSQVTINFLRTPTVDSSSMIARSRLVHATRTLALTDATVADAHGAVLGHATSRAVIVPLEPHTRDDERADARVSSLEPDPYASPLNWTGEGHAVWAKTSGLERLQDVARRTYPTPVLRFTGARVLAVTEGRVSVGLAASPWLANYGGSIYGGATTFLAEGASTGAVLSTLPADTACAPLDLSINLLRPVRPHDGELIATASVTHRGKTMATVHCELRAQDKVVAVAHETVLILPGRPWNDPIHVANEVGSSPPAQSSEDD